MIVGLLSDTHGRLPIKADCALAECDHIIHAGDICDKGILDLLGLYAPVTAVLGNNDYLEYGSGVGRFADVELDGVRLLVCHYPQDVIGEKAIRALGVDGYPEVCVHGHTHVPRLVAGEEASPAKLLVCPGSCSMPREGSPATVAKVEVRQGRIVRAKIERIDDGEACLEWFPDESLR